MPKAQVEASINDSVRRLLEHPDFAAWLESVAPSSGDVVLINNSFVFRDVKTKKAEEFLALRISEAGTEPEMSIAHGAHFNVDFKRFSSSATNLPTTSSLSSNIKPQLEHLGHLVFLLIGEIDDTEIVETPLNHNAFTSVTWDPSSTELAHMDGDRIVVGRTDDENEIWNAVREQLVTAGVDVPDGLRESFGVALDKLQDQAVARVRIPEVGASASTGITDAILTVLREQRDQYGDAVAKLTSGAATADLALNDVLRLAYNFASDATGYLRLIVSICDLKPIVLWGAIAEHYALSVAFHSLPWARSRNKPSLKNYQQSIADARNSAFHNLFPFRKTLRVPLPEAALGSPELQIFSEHARKASNQLTYKDQELVDVLVEFTRARERRLPSAFWEKNLDVMNATIALFERTNEFVKMLAAARAA